MFGQRKKRARISMKNKERRSAKRFSSTIKRERLRYSENHFLARLYIWMPSKHRYIFLESISCMCACNSSRIQSYSPCNILAASLVSRLRNNPPRFPNVLSVCTSYDIYLYMYTHPSARLPCESRDPLCFGDDDEFLALTSEAIEIENTV